MVKPAPLPDSEATDLIVARFGPDRTVEQWVDSSVGISNRTRLFGAKALEHAAVVLGVNVLEHPTHLKTGNLQIINGLFFAFIRSGMSRYLRNVTVGHEIAHASVFIMAPDLDQNDDPTLERFCEMFAHELISPSVRRRG